MFWVQFVVAIALHVISSYLNKPQVSHVAASEDLDVPAVKTGSSIPLLRGTRDIESPAVVNYGNIKAKAIKKSGGKK